MMEPLDPSDPLASIEERLQFLQPAALPAPLETRLAEVDTAGGKVIHHIWRWVSLAAAASLAIAAWFVGAHRTTDPAPGAAQSDVTPESLRIYTPISSRNFLLNAREIGVITPENSPPIRLVRCLWLDDATYRDSDGHADDLQVTRTREQIIPVALTFY
jgi:hypothetical protein